MTLHNLTIEVLENLFQNLTHLDELDRYTQIQSKLQSEEDRNLYLKHLHRRWLHCIVHLESLSHSLSTCCVDLHHIPLQNQSCVNVLVTGTLDPL